MTVPGVSFTACGVPSLITFPVVETLHPIASLLDCAEGAQLLRLADFTFCIYSRDRETGKH